jgi:hypothetical protein
MILFFIGLTYLLCYLQHNRIEDKLDIVIKDIIHMVKSVDKS